MIVSGSNYYFVNFGFSKIGNLEIINIWKFGKDARREMIDICLVKSASTSVVC